MAAVRFNTDNLSHGQLSDANKMVYRELERVHKANRCKGDCAGCSASEYCDWLHLFQLAILKTINEDPYAGVGGGGVGAT